MSEQPQTIDYGSEFESRLPLYESLAEEVLFVMNDAVTKTQIKTHSVLARVKSRASFLEKVSRKNYHHPFENVQDLVGGRIVCLFYDDIPNLANLVRQHFNVLSEENKIQDAPDDTFGYMSVHFTCTLHDHYTGPRYDRLKGIVFEIQVRTILMDAWANVSHHLAYKGEASIPAQLRRDFHALSGLFYVADKQFQTFFDGVVKTEDDTPPAEMDPFPVPIDRASVRKFLRQMFPDRQNSPSSEISELVEEVVEVGYATIDQLRDGIAAGLDEALEAEMQISVDDGGLTDVGLARFALAMRDDAYFEHVYGELPGFPRIPTSIDDGADEEPQ